MTEEPTSPLRGVRVLLVEDRDDTREALGDYLALSGALVLNRSNGA